MRRAKFDLKRLIQAVREGQVHLGKTRCRDVLLAYVGTLTECHAFACEVATLLAPEWFCTTLTLSGVDYDEYVAILPEEILERFGLCDVVWYVKFTLRPNDLGEQVFFLSLHPLERPQQCAVGWISPQRRSPP